MSALCSVLAVATIADLHGSSSLLIGIGVAVSEMVLEQSMAELIH